MVGRTLRMSCGSFSRLSEKVTGMPQRSGRNSITTRCAMCAEGRNATVRILRPDRQHRRTHIDVRHDRAGASPAPSSARRWRREVRYRIAVSDGCDLGADARRAARDRAPSPRGPCARSPSSVSAPSASPVSRIQCSTGAPRSACKRLRILDEHRARARRRHRAAPGPPADSSGTSPPRSSRCAMIPRSAR